MKGTSSFDRAYNLMYLLTGTESFSTKWNPYDISYTNIIVYDIPKELQLELFKEAELEENEVILELFFEQYYDTVQHKMKCVGNGAKIVNNFNLEERTIAEQILIVTIATKSKQKRFWLSDKWGFDKRCIKIVDLQTDWQLDVYNRRLQFFEYDESGNLQLNTIEYN